MLSKSLRYPFVAPACGWLGLASGLRGRLRAFSLRAFMASFKTSAIICLFLGPGMLIMNYYDNAGRQKIDREGVQMVAIPVSKSDLRGRKGKHTYKVELQYPVRGLGNQRTTAEISQTLYDQLETKKFLQIKYLKDDVSKVIIIGERIVKPEMYYAGGILLAIGVIGTWWTVFRKKNDAPLESSPA